MNRNLEYALKRVQKPSRYVGGEYNQIVKDKGKVDVRIAYCFPETYEIGMSNLGLQIMYGLFNTIDDVWCERVFAPWSDMEEEMRTEGINLYALESGDEIKDFDIIAFSLGYELTYTNVLNMLNLAGIPLRSVSRSENDPLIIAGGTCCYNPEPVAEFFDLFVIGEGEEVAVELIAAYKTAKRSNLSKSDFLSNASCIKGIYVPSLYAICYNDENTISEISPIGNAPLPVKKRIVEDLDAAFYPVKCIVPSMEIVHDRVSLELMRGCFRGCKFCHAGHVCHPVRQRSCEKLVQLGTQSLENSGYDEIALLSLSTSDYGELNRLCDDLLCYCEPRNISLSLPSLRADNFSVELLEKVQKVRKSGLTFAPEAGSQRLRDVINKNITEEDLLQTCGLAFEGGYNSVKLYFMLGLPTETDEDVLAIAQLARAVHRTWKERSQNRSRGVRITISTSCFIPKAHTPFQYEAQISIDEYQRRVQLLKEAIGTKAITYNWHDPGQALIEAALSRGDRRLSDVIEAAWENGARLDSWSEHFSLNLWQVAFQLCGTNADFYAARKRDKDEMPPWGHIACGYGAG